MMQAVKSLRFRRRLPGPCLSPSALEEVKVGASEAALIRAWDLGPVLVPRTQSHSDSGDADVNNAWKTLPKAPAPHGGCAFFDANEHRCRLRAGPADARPTPCRTFPVWPSFVATDFDWFERGPSIAPGAYTPLPLDSPAPAVGSSDVTVPPVKSSEEVADNSQEEVSLSSLEVARLLAHQSAYDAGMLEGFSGGFVGTAALLAEAVEDADAYAVRDDVLRARSAVHMNDALVVLDTLLADESTEDDNHSADEVVVRSLHFRARPGLVQSASLRSRFTGLPPLGKPPHGTHVQGLALGLTLLNAAPNLSNLSAHDTGLRAAVLGAGGCALPLFLATLQHNKGIGHSEQVFESVVAVEASEEVVDAAQNFFLDKLPPGEYTSDNNSIESDSASGHDDSPLISHNYRAGVKGECALSLVHGRAEAWLAATRDSPDLVDFLVVDIEDGAAVDESVECTTSGGSGSRSSGLVAPPSWCLSPAFLNACVARLSPRGVLAVHVVGPSQSHEAVVAALHAAGLFVVHRASHVGPHPPSATAVHGDAMAGKEVSPSVAAIGRESAFFAQRSFESEATDWQPGEGPGNEASWLSERLQALPLLLDDSSSWSFERLS